MDIYQIYAIFMWICAVVTIIGFIGWGITHEKYEKVLCKLCEREENEVELRKEITFLKSRLTKYELAEAKKR